MKIEVTQTYRDAAGNARDVHDNAESYHIDTEGQLHIKGSGSETGNIASYARGCWTAVKKVETEGPIEDSRES